LEIYSGIIYVVILVYVAYQVLKSIFGGSWATKNIGGSLYNLGKDFKEHLSKHKK